MTNERPPPSLEDLDARLKQARRSAGLDVDEVAEAAAAGSGRDMGLGLRMAIELVAGVVVGLMLGLGADKWFGSKPWGLIVGLFMGAVAGFMNVYRAASGQGYAAGFKKSPEHRGDTGE